MSKITKFNRDSPMQRIRAHFLDDRVEITAHEKEKLERLTFMYNLRLKGRYSKDQAMKKTRKVYGTSQATAYRDYQEMCTLFGEFEAAAEKIEVAFHRENYHFLYRKLLKENKWEAAAKVYEKYVATFPEVKEDESYLDLHTKKYVMSIDKELEKLMKKHLQNNPVVDLSAMDFEDVDFKVEDDES